MLREWIRRYLGIEALDSRVEKHDDTLSSHYSYIASVRAAWKQDQEGRLTFDAETVKRLDSLESHLGLNKNPNLPPQQSRLEQHSETISSLLASSGKHHLRIDALEAFAKHVSEQTAKKPKPTKK